MGDCKLEFSRLLDYADMIKSSNPRTSCWVRTDNETVPGKHLFKYFYVCFGALKNGWLEGCRKIIGLDGCFLKGACKGELLVAVGRNGNQQMYPIAWAVVDQETKHSWSWFLRYLIEDLNLGDGYGITIMSDMQMVMPTDCCSATMGFGVYTDTQSGRQVINPGRTSERMISSGSLKDASQTNVDLEFEPPGLKWK